MSCDVQSKIDRYFNTSYIDIVLSNQAINGIRAIPYSISANSRDIYYLPWDNE